MTGSKHLKIGFSLFSIVLLALGALYFSSYGILVKEVFPGREDTLIGKLSCHYFVGTKVLERQYLYSSTGLVGKSACPRIIYFGEGEDRE